MGGRFYTNYRFVCTEKRLESNLFQVKGKGALCLGCICLKSC